MEERFRLIECSAFSVSATKLKGIDLDAPGNINGVPVVDVDMESFEEKPWRKPGTGRRSLSAHLNPPLWPVHDHVLQRGLGPHLIITYLHVLYVFYPPPHFVWLTWVLVCLDRSGPLRLL